MLDVLTHVGAAMAGAAVAIVVWEFWLEKRGEKIYDRIARKLRAAIIDELREFISRLDSNRSW